MAKTKKRRLADIKIEKTQLRKKSTTNPFEVHVNKQKFHVLGRKMKQDRGMPGIARAKSIKKRKETLLQEYKVKDKSNKFVDRRIGERNSAMTNEDRILARFTAERLKAHKRKGMFNLGEDEILTHKGRSLAEIETFEGPSSDEEDNELSKGKLDANFVEEAHFGGGLFKKTDESKGRTAVIDQLIAESKKRKLEKQEVKEKTLLRTEELDSEWRELMPMVAASSATDTVEPVEKKDPYDLIVNQLKFEARGTPTDRLKTESELAAEEARKLRELEEERLRRMRGGDEHMDVNKSNENKRQHRSADDLDDGFQFDEEEDFQLLYDKEGKLITKIKDNEDMTEEEVERSSLSKHKDEVIGEENSEEEEVENDDESGEEESNNDEEDDEKSSESEGEAVFDLSDMKETRKEESEEEIEVEDESVEDKKVRKEMKKTLKVRRSSLNESEREDNIGKKKVAFNPVVKTITITESIKMKNEEEIKKDESENRKLMEEASSDLPFTFTIPETYDELENLIADKSIEEQTIIIERMIKCNHPSLNEKNKPALNNLFAFLLQLLNDADYTECWRLLHHMVPHLFELAKFSPSHAAYCLSEVLKEKHDEYLIKKHRYPQIETLVFLKLIPSLFPTSDKRHPITTPALVFIAEMLQQCQVTTRKAITSGLFLVTLYTQYTSLSKRILPEVINFLCGIINMATPVTTKALIVPPFVREQKFLYLHNSCTDLNDATNLRMQAKDLAPKSIKIDDEFRIRSVYVSLNLLTIVVEQWKNLPGSWLILSPVMDHIAGLQKEKYPNVVGITLEKLKTSLENIKAEGFEKIVKEERKPKALRLYDPQIQTVYDNRKRKYDDEKSEQKKLLTKYKQEMRGALREIRRDRSFLAGVKFKEIAKNDAVRKKKVKEIYSWGTQQQSELNKLARQKRRKK